MIALPPACPTRRSVRAHSDSNSTLPQTPPPPISQPTPPSRGGSLGVLEKEAGFGSRIPRQDTSRWGYRSASTRSRDKAAPVTPYRDPSCREMLWTRRREAVSSTESFGERGRDCLAHHISCHPRIAHLTKNEHGLCLSSRDRLALLCV